MLVVDVPIFCGRYVTRVRIGRMRLCSQADVPRKGVSDMSRMHSVAAAVMIGVTSGVVAGVRPPSTAMNSGEDDCSVMAGIWAR